MIDGHITLYVCFALHRDYDVHGGRGGFGGGNSLGKSRNALVIACGGITNIYIYMYVCYNNIYIILYKPHKTAAGGPVRLSSPRCGVPCR